MSKSIYDLLGLFSSNHSITELIAQTAPEERTPSKNQLIFSETPYNEWIGEKITNDKNHPPWKPKHIGQVMIPWINPKIGL